jgi:hypothetical protein
MAELSLIERLHLEQVGQLLFRAGVELSVPGSPELSGYVRRLFHLNCTSLHFDRLWELGATDGSVLIYIHPSDGLVGTPDYCLKYFPRSQFSVEFDAFGTVASAIISWQEKQMSGVLYRQVKLGIEEISEWSSTNPIGNSPPNSIYPNHYGFVPAVLIANRAAFPGEMGQSEFANLQSEIDAWNAADSEIAANVNLFAGPILYTSRSRSELEESRVIRRSADEISGFGERRTAAPLVRLRSIVDNYDPEHDVLGYLSPAPIPGQLFEYLLDRRKQLRSALGSVDESRLYNSQFVLRSPAELSLTLSFAINTARKRSQNYLTYGLAKAYEIALRMADADGKVSVGDGFLALSPLVNWRYLGDVWKTSPQEQLQSSIVARNMGRLGVAPLEVLRYLFPDKEQAELEAMVEGGFAYEFLSGVAEVAAKIEATSLSEEVKSDFITPFLKREISSNDHTATP